MNENGFSRLYLLDMDTREFAPVEGLPTGLVGIVLGVYAFQLVFSTLWLRAFAMGPIEWLWRSWTYLRPARLMKPKPAA